MAKRTQAQVIEIYKKNRFTVLAFNSETGKRETTHGGCDIITSLGEIVRKTSLGFKVLVFDYNDEKIDFIRLEIQKGSRITYDEVKHLSLKNVF